MTTHTSKLLLSVAALAIGLTMAVGSADAAPARKGKGKKIKAVPVAAKVQQRRTASSRHWGTSLVPAGPLYHGREYLGDDPDPNIRFELMRDISNRYGGDE